MKANCRQKLSKALVRFDFGRLILAVNLLSDCQQAFNLHSFGINLFSYAVDFVVCIYIYFIYIYQLLSH